MTTVTEVRPKLNAAPSVMASDLNNALVAAGKISLQEVEFRYLDTTGQKVKIEFSYETSTDGANYRAVSFISNSFSTADAKAQAYFTANPNFRAVKVLDISNPYRRSTLRNGMIAIGIADYSVSIFLNKPLTLVAPVANIAAGASGQANVLVPGNSTGPQISVTNRGNAAWTAGAFGWAAPDPVTGNWDGYVNCC